MEPHPVKTMGTADLKRVGEQLWNSRVLTTLSEMLTCIANEINNPLGSILLYSELLIAGEDSPQTKEDLRVIHEEARRAARTMAELLNYCRQEKPEVCCIEINSILEDLFCAEYYTNKVRDINLTLDLEQSPLPVEGNLSQLNQLFSTLMTNAEEALAKAGGGEITLTTRREGEWVQILFADDGPGIPPEHLQRIFFPFFTTKQAVPGSGLGLSTCYSIVTRHNGLISAQNNETRGVTITVEFPLASTTEKQPGYEYTRRTDTLVAAIGQI